MDCIKLFNTYKKVGWVSLGERAMSYQGYQRLNSLKLRDGNCMPCIGLGLSPGMIRMGENNFAPVPLPPNKLKNILLAAFSVGYRFLSTAQIYKNEQDISKALKESGIPRSEFFIAGKVWHTDHGYEETRTSVLNTLKELNLDYYDLYMIHSPYSHKLSETYKALLDLKEEGKIHSVGVSNFGIAHIEGLISQGFPPPVVNEVELHPWQMKNKEGLVFYCQQNCIALVAHCPIAKGQKEDDPLIQKLCSKYHRTYAQILLRWSVQHSFVPIPRTHTLERLEENYKIFDFNLEENDMKQLDNLPSQIFSWNSQDPTKEKWIQ